MNSKKRNDLPTVTLMMVMSANGVVAQSSVENSFEWNSAEDKAQFIERVQSIGTVLMGSNTYRSIGGKPYEGVSFYVMSRHPEKFAPHPKVQFRQGTVESVLLELKRAGIQQVGLLGGPQINGQALRRGLVDDIYLTLEPLLMPNGLQITDKLDSRIDLRLASSEALNDLKTLLLHYRVVHQND